MNNNNNKPSPLRTQPIRERKPFNDFLATNLDATIADRYCVKCHLKLIHNPRNIPQDKYIYSCPQCNVTNNIYNTEPTEKIVTMFPTHNAVTNNSSSSSGNKKKITQPDNQRISRSQYFIQQNLKKKNEIEDNDPYLRILKQNNKIIITNIDYYDPNEYYDE